MSQAWAEGWAILGMRDLSFSVFIPWRAKLFGTTVDPLDLEAAAGEHFSVSVCRRRDEWGLI
ncbi:MAG TPA: hypothetical protein VLT36_06740 [Candidatus Dormibacteraeota bacterium]|nr:hypothetical protein [Candidatus Dormibacteraeota bacterium]